MSVYLCVDQLAIEIFHTKKKAQKYRVIETGRACILGSCTILKR